MTVEELLRMLIEAFIQVLVRDIPIPVILSMAIAFGLLQWFKKNKKKRK